MQKPPLRAKVKVEVRFEIQCGGVQQNPILRFPKKKALWRHAAAAGASLGLRPAYGALYRGEGGRVGKGAAAPTPSEGLAGC